MLEQLMDWQLNSQIGFLNTVARSVPFSESSYEFASLFF